MPKKHRDSSSFELKKPDHIYIYEDIDGHRINGLTIPCNIVVTQQRPDIVVVDNSTPQPTVWLFELTCSFERNIDQAHTRKQVRYTQLELDIKDNGYGCKNVPFEVGSRGHLTLANRSILSTLHKLAPPKMKLKTFLQTISKICLLCSYSIYNSRSEGGWSKPPPLRPYRPSM